MLNREQGINRRRRGRDAVPPTCHDRLVVRDFLPEKQLAKTDAEIARRMRYTQRNWRT